MKQYVIIGNCIAAAGCIEGIRSVDKEGAITVISGESRKVYSRPLISYYLEKKTDCEKMNYRPADFYEKMNCNVIYGHKAVQIQPDNKKVVLDNGTELPYSSVCVATGSSPFCPPFDGLSSVKQKFSFFTLDDALALEASVTKEKRVLIIGAGLIGLKCAEGLRNLAGSITVCDLADHILPSILDAECAAPIQKHLSDNGIRFLLQQSIQHFDRNTATMKNGETVDFDILVLAVGVRPNVSLVKDLGGEVNRGILVNEKLETSIADVYAAGDCTEGEDVSAGQKRVLALLPNAYIQGYTAGGSMAGGNPSYQDAIPMNSIGFFGLHIMTAGSYVGRMYEERHGEFIKRLYVSEDRLKGFVLIGATERAGIYTSLIRKQTPLSTINFELLKKTATTAAFSKMSRKEMFGGECHDNDSCR